MEPMTFTVLRFDGDYAILKRTDCEIDAEIPMARALLPEEITEGCMLLRFYNSTETQKHRPCCLARTVFYLL